MDRTAVPGSALTLRPPPDEPARSTSVPAHLLASVPDAELFVLVEQRDLQALEVLYDRHVDAVWHGALRLTGDAAASERAVTAAFMAIWTGRASLGGSRVVTRLLALVWGEVRASQRLTPRG